VPQVPGQPLWLTQKARKDHPFGPFRLALPPLRSHGTIEARQREKSRLHADIGTLAKDTVPAPASPRVITRLEQH
jgi:hypothetical protein